MQKGPPTPKGFRDIKPELAKKKREVILKISAVLEEFGFVPIETPTIEFTETLKGKYGEEEKLIYEFKDRGGRDLALRYDLTVPLARYVATYNPPLPFRRYQIGQVFRGENPQAGRYREFTQFDFDTVGSSDLEEDAKIIAAAIQAASRIGVNKAEMAINDRANFEGIPLDVIRAFDKIHKIEQSGVEEELRNKKYSQDQINKYMKRLLTPHRSSNYEKLVELLRNQQMWENHEFFLDESLARGLDYYTGLIFELKIGGDLKAPSLGAGGRYDNLIGMFSKKETPAVGFSFGLDRLIEALPG
ncbi:MAG TPA: histidine--tRNA ligase [Patescibacteria group bacterium]|nr:histidine--tRNA ligase [Patescibacteria group bacterium]